MAAELELIYLKIETMKRILSQMLGGNSMPEMLMHIIRFVMPSRSKPLKKLLYFYYELSNKHDQNGKLRQEWILVCNAMRLDLQHPNVRGLGSCMLAEADPV
jgi:coatomer subunit beta